jgi:hypothetical protein
LPLGAHVGLRAALVKGGSSAHGPATLGLAKAKCRC